MTQVFAPPLRDLKGKRPTRIGPVQHNVLRDMIDNGGWWPKAMRFSERERKAMRKLVDRGWVVKCPDGAFGESYGTHYIPHFLFEVIEKRVKS